MAAIARWAMFDDQKLKRMRLAARAYARHYLESSGAVEQNKALFKRAVNLALSMEAPLTTDDAKAFLHGALHRLT